MFVFFFDTYMAVIGDIINSKEIANRGEVQDALRRVLIAVNRKYAPQLASDFMITLGDEFQGLLRYGNDAMNIISEIELAMEPVKLRFGLGIGEIDTEIDRSMPLGADGPAYHNARKMIERLKANEKKYSMYDTNIMIASNGDNEQIDALLNSIFSLSTALKNKWSPRQREVINCYLKNEKNQYKAAGELGIRQSNVSRILKKADFYTYLQAIETVNAVLSEVRGPANV